MLSEFKTNLSVLGIIVALLLGLSHLQSVSDLFDLFFSLHH